MWQKLNKKGFLETKSNSRKISIVPRGKGGSLETKEIIEFILAAAGIFLLIVLFFQLIAPNFNRDEQTAKTSLEALRKALQTVDEEGRANLELWAGEPKMVYFGDKNSAQFGEDEFFTFQEGKNKICFCYEEDKRWICDYCENMDYPAFFNLGLTKPKEQVVFEEGWAFEITKEEGGSEDQEGTYYVFRATQIPRTENAKS